MILLAYVMLGVVAGIFSGLLGIGGGTLVVPGLVYLFGMAQHKAQGTILAAFLPPVVFLAFLKYYQTGNVDLKVAGFIAVGIFLGSMLGANLSLSMPELLLKRVFAVFLIVVAAQLMFGR
ncbi:MAG: sulfite exporter TauE/SafE family protein [Candidatus Omnitrophica bacterium]|nr:sulfite exporter TauE/SafE family protein [Candidatus Omnitrophota bacterium]